MIKVAIVEDHKLFRDGIKLILADDPDIELISESVNGVEFLKIIESIAPDVVLMDISMPEMNGIETTIKALEINPSLKILTLSMFNEEDYYYKMLHAGVKGFLLKESKSHELKEAILKINEGGNYFSSDLLRKILFQFGNEPINNQKEGLLFNENEKELFKHICLGLSDLEVAKTLNMREEIINKQRLDLIKKTNTSDTADLIMFAIKNNIIQI